MKKIGIVKDSNRLDIENIASLTFDDKSNVYLMRLEDKSLVVYPRENIDYMHVVEWEANVPAQSTDIEEAEVIDEGNN